MVKKKQPSTEGNRRVTGLHLFKKDYWAKRKAQAKFTTIQDAAEDGRKAWENLTAQQKNDYAMKAKEERDRMASPPSIKGSELLTRCSPKQFVEVAKYVNTIERLKGKARDIGFEKILKLSCTKIPRELCDKLISAIEPETCCICIRNCRQKIDGSIVEMFMGLPNKGNDVGDGGSIDNELFQKLKKFSKKRFSKIKELIFSGEEEEMFEVLLVLYTLGTLLCPTTNGGITERLIKIVSCNKEQLASYNWCNFVVNELMKEVDEYKKATKKGVTGKYIGGCIYLLIVSITILFYNIT